MHPSIHSSMHWSIRTSIHPSVRRRPSLCRYLSRRNRDSRCYDIISGCTETCCNLVLKMRRETVKCSRCFISETLAVSRRQPAVWVHCFHVHVTRTQTSVVCPQMKIVNFIVKCL
jgi:hypothetical protein